jgi:hypothetical protein
MNAKDRDVGRNLFVLQDMRQAVPQIFVRDRRYRCCLCDSVDIEERGKGHADPYGYSQIGQNGQ